MSGNMVNNNINKVPTMVAVNVRLTLKISAPIKPALIEEHKTVIKYDVKMLADKSAPEAIKIGAKK